MKLSLVILTLTFSLLSFAECQITVTKKKLDAKSAFLANKSISAKTIQQLKDAGCTVNAKLMSVSQLIELERVASAKRIERLKKGAN